MRRSRRIRDPYQTSAWLSDLYLKLKTSALPDADDAEFRKLLFAVQYAERGRGGSARKRRTGRKARFDDRFLFDTAARLRTVLETETGGRISLLRFISTYLPAMNFPADIRSALDDYRLNLEEARTLCRINRDSLGETVRRKPSDIRRDLMDSHLRRQGTQAELKRRVDQRLRATPKAEANAVAANLTEIDARVDALLELSEFDTEHLLWEEIKSLVFLMRDVDSEIVDSETTDFVLRELDTVKLRLLKFRRTPESD